MFDLPDSDSGRDPDCVHLAHTFSGLVRSESGVTAHFVNDRVVEGDALIGCDGCRSAVRDRVCGSAPASYTGQVAFRALIPCENELEHLSTQGASMKTDEQLDLQARLGSWIDEFESNRSMTFVAKPWTPRLPLQQRAALHGF
jgi:2-polyprenyl-6-methoxyphenol hydroxylase-like FAD-dependent oxidoreductase